jgi:hypothetical protein
MSRKVSAKVKLKYVDISKKHLERAEKVSLIKMVHNGEDSEFIPITIVDRELKEWTSRMDRGLKLKGHMFETGFLPLSIFIFDIDYSQLRKE